MTTTLPSHTATISIDAPPAAVLDLVADPEQLPRWAPGFAREVRRDGEDWLVSGDTAAGERRVCIRIDRDLGVVDYLTPEGILGAASRVIANAAGSEMLFTVFFPPEASEPDREAQRAVVADELAAVRELASSSAR
ncbi:MAG TPA: SRPBCC family protein [Solirubrobacteraceae bacterium]|jgi:hypothetical protein|nr:SRPBCC family protein [Solirubrobacteraceae bacterium]